MEGGRCRGQVQEPVSGWWSLRCPKGTLACLASGPGSVVDSHLQQPRGPLAIAAAAVAATATVLAVSRLLSVSVSVGSVDMEVTSLVEEDVEG